MSGINYMCRKCGRATFRTHNSSTCLEVKAQLCADCYYVAQQAPPAGLQTPIDESYTAIPPLALAKVATVMASGTRKYGPRNWDKISVSDHLDHAIRHGYLYIIGDTTDEPTGVDHLAHMACRALMALEVEMIRQQQTQRKADEARSEDDLLRCYNQPTNGNGDS